MPAGRRSGIWPRCAPGWEAAGDALTGTEAALKQAEARFAAADERVAAAENALHAACADREAARPDRYAAGQRPSRPGPWWNACNGA